VTTMADQEWRTKAACRNEDAELFFPERTSPYAYALPRSICSRCTVRTECLESALKQPQTNDSTGMFGGFTPDERRQIRRCRAGTCQHDHHRGQP